ncbi:hypothetical protein DSM21852_41960 [Methylocystis bryophila]|nr:hypothetical protein DSM21852_41960 [Methylocystis bryophila]
MPLNQTVAVLDELRQLAIGKKQRDAENPGRDQRKEEQEAGKSQQKRDSQAIRPIPEGKDEDERENRETDQGNEGHAVGFLFSV